MKFRKLVLFLMIGAFIFNISSLKAYAAEEATVNPDVEIVVLESTGLDGVVDESVVIESAALGSTPLESATEGSTLEGSTLDGSTVEESAVEENAVEENPVKEVSIDNKETSRIVETETIKYSKAELRLLSALIYCEAQGESYNGKLAVGIVVMNRVRSERYPNTLKGVIYQKYQFSPVRNGTLKKALSEYDKGKFTSAAEKECIKAAKGALNGTKSITVKGKEKSFNKFLSFSGRLRGNTLQLENHQFK